MGSLSFQLYDDDAALADAVVRDWCSLLGAAKQSARSHTVALSGGRISQRVFSALAATGDLTAEMVHYFWADERCVPPDHADSNYLSARRYLFEPAGISDDIIHRIRGEDEPLRAANLATAELRAVTSTAPDADACAGPCFVRHGRGRSCCIAFPGHDRILTNETAVYLPVEDSPKPPPSRVTLAPGPILAAREVWVTVAGWWKGRSTAGIAQPSRENSVGFDHLPPRAYSRVFDSAVAWLSAMKRSLLQDAICYHRITGQIHNDELDPHFTLHGYCHMRMHRTSMR